MIKKKKKIFYRKKTTELTKLKIEFSYDSGITVLCIYLKKIELAYQRNASISMFVVVIFTIAKICNPGIHGYMNG
jgi:hypothetical protein